MMKPPNSPSPTAERALPQRSPITSSNRSFRQNRMAWVSASRSAGRSSRRMVAGLEPSRTRAAERSSASPSLPLPQLVRTMETEPTVHIVEDDGAVRRSLECLLHAAGFKSMAYETALSFLDAAPGVSAGCVLLHVRMPEIDGLELQARLNRLGSLLPVIVMTGGGEVDDAVRAMKAGAVDFIEKPFDDERLLGAIEEALTMSEWSARNRETAEAAERIGTLSRRERQVVDALST